MTATPPIVGAGDCKTMTTPKPSADEEQFWLDIIIHAMETERDLNKAFQRYNGDMDWIEFVRKHYLPEMLPRIVDHTKQEVRTARQESFVSALVVCSFKDGCANCKANKLSLEYLAEAQKDTQAELPHIDIGPGFTHSGSGNTCGCRAPNAKEDVV